MSLHRPTLVLASLAALAGLTACSSSGGDSTPATATVTTTVPGGPTTSPATTASSSSAAGGGGAQVQQATRVTGGAVGGTVEQVATVTVAPGASVFAWLEGQSTKQAGAAQAGCDAPDHPQILVTPPNTTTAVPFSIGWPQCYSFNVHPVRAQ